MTLILFVVSQAFFFIQQIIISISKKIFPISSIL